MPREKDPFRNQVEFLQNTDRWKCSHCKKVYKGSVTRIKAHLARVPGYGINPCEDVDGRVRSKALKALKGKTAVEPSSRLDNDEEGPHQPVTAIDDDAQREPSLPNPSIPAQIANPEIDLSSWPPSTQYHAGDSNIQLPNLSYPINHPALALEALTNMLAPVNAEVGEPNTEVLQDVRTEDVVMVGQPGDDELVNENVPSLKKKRKKRSNGEVVNNCRHCSFRKSSTAHATTRRKSSPLLTTLLVGKESKKAINKICNYLMEDEIVILGIYGMGGVGKTAILMHVHNEVLENPVCNDVFWVTAPQEFSIYELQEEIANAVGLDNLSKVLDMKRRASTLNRHLQKKRAILILDGLWKHFDFEDVGIPIEKGGIKLVLTTRSLDVCHKMLCQKQIEITCLPHRHDWWDLFLKKLCFGKDLPLEVEEIAKSILSKCQGLPLAIIEIATHMRGVEEVREWKDLLQKLENSIMELNVFKKLKLSYMNLDNLQVQQCFLHLVLCFDENKFEMLKIFLIESLIDEGLLSGMATRHELHYKGNSILDKIKKACLGIDIEENYIFIHPLLRNVALQIVTSTTHMNKANMNLKEIPEEEFWTDHLKKVFLHNNWIKEIPYGMSPNCPNLTSLSLSGNSSLKAIHESFFRHLNGLKCLDLSSTRLMELPNTISHLESLEALLLYQCRQLRRIPCVQKLGSLGKLDLSGCRMLEEVPKGMEMLVKLSYLDLRGTKIEMLSEGVLGKLVNLQYLAISNRMKWMHMIILKKVEALYCSAPNVDTFNVWVRFLEQNSSRPYELWLNDSEDFSFKDKHERHIIIKSCHSITARLDGEIGGDGHALLPKNVQVLEVGRCDEVTSLCEIGPLYNLEKLKIEEWEKLEELGAVHFPYLRRLSITGCSKLKHLMEVGQGLPCLQWFKIEGSEELEWINIVAPFLYNIKVDRCPKMKRVVEWKWLDTGIPKLRSIEIKNCEQLKEIIGGQEGCKGATCRLTKIEIEGCNSLKSVLMTLAILPSVPLLRHLSVKDCKSIKLIISSAPRMAGPSLLKLTHLTLWNLPELEAIYDETVSCYSIEFINIINCPKMKRLPLLDNGLPRPPRSSDSIRIDQLTWQSLEWDHCLFPPSLEHLARKYEEVSDQRILKHINRTTARVDKEIGGDGCNQLPENVQILTVGGGSGVTSLSELSLLVNLEELTIEDCEKLEELGAVHFPRLRVLEIARCSKLKHLLVDGQGFPHLQWFKINGSEELEGISLAAPNLKLLEVSQCSKMKRGVEWVWPATSLPDLESIRIQCCEKLEEIIGGPLPIYATCHLTKIEIDRCNNMKGVLLTQDVWLYLPFLQQITVEDCKGIEVIIGTTPNVTQLSFPKLTHLTLKYLPKLKRICDQIKSCDNIQFIEILDCPMLKRIPLRLQRRNCGLLSPPSSLGQILIDRQTWQAIQWETRKGSTWGDPLAAGFPARYSLEPFIKFIPDQGW